MITSPDRQDNSTGAACVNTRGHGLLALAEAHAARTGNERAAAMLRAILDAVTGKDKRNDH
jgi:hypothetical protein